MTPYRTWVRLNTVSKTHQTERKKKKMPDVNANGIKWNRDEYMNIFDLEDNEMNYYAEMFPDAF